MTWSVYQSWDPLKVCVVGRCYPPEFFSWIKTPRVREAFERVATETEEDFQTLIRLLESFGVTVLRPELPAYNNLQQQYSAPPVNPRDFMSMIHDTFYQGVTKEFNFTQFYNNVKDASWPECASLDAFKSLPTSIQEECNQLHKLEDSMLRSEELNNNLGCYTQIFDQIKQQGNNIVDLIEPWSRSYTDGSMVNILGNDLFFGTFDYNEDQQVLLERLNLKFPNTKNHIINTGGHLDGVFVPVAPGLIFSLRDVPSFDESHPGWEVIWLDGNLVDNSVLVAKSNWWIPGYENDVDVEQTVELFLKHWTGYISETVFDINLLHINPKNVIVSEYNPVTFDAFNRFGITPHVVPFRHRHFWDCGIHCITADLHRSGYAQDWV
jgi:hypothetical protein